MPPLRVPGDGLLLSGSPGESQSFPSQAFAITLGDDVIGDLVRCAQDGGDIELSLGSSPTLHYASNSHTIPRSADTTPHDFYLTQPFSESIKRARKVPNTMSIFSKPKILAQTGQYSSPRTQAAAKGKTGKEKPKSGLSSGLESGIETLQNNLAQAEAQEGRTLLIEGRPGSKKGKPKLLSTMARGSSAPRSMPTSPAVSAAGGSPSLGATMSGSEKMLERKKGKRISIIHELAAQDQTYEYLESKWTGPPEDFKKTLEKIADFNEEKQAWVMSRTFWKELDVWNYDYKTPEMRQQAIDNAVRQYDKMRLSIAQPQWELLLPKEERGTGKCLSKVQANLTKGPTAAVQRPPAPKIKVQKAGDGAADSGRDSDAKAAAMSRSVSNPLPIKKKMSEREAQQKRLLSRKTGTAPKSASPVKSKAQGAKPNGAPKVLSQEYVQDSDSDSEDQVLAAKPKPPPEVKAAVQNGRPSHVVAAKNRGAAASKPRVVRPREPGKTAKPTPKRAREEEDDGDSSSSGTPLSKRLKQKPAKASAPPAVAKHRQSDASLGSRGSSTGMSYKSKNTTSPTKSSPLASSPPTNASDLDQPQDTIAARPIIPARKRPPERDVEEDKARAKKARAQAQAQAARQEVPNDLSQKARKFKMYYEKYEELHWEISALEDPPRDKVSNLLDMRERLQSMKSEIYRECSADRD